ncbi:MAG TPA: ParB N-terminal domain-containing protein, partial [Chitinophagales bacterium]|nr:ParB N-terminal domain-containing protein [Chitinophagales bacterium]
MSSKKTDLGKGIRALLEGMDSTPSAPKPDPQQVASLGMVSKLALDVIEVNPFQPRVDFDEARLKELADSIRIHGVIQPVTVKKLPNRKFQLIAGEHR